MGSVSSPGVPRHNGRFSVLALFWCVGLASGTLAGVYAGVPVSSLMRIAPIGPVSIVSLLFMTFLPFLFSAAAVFFSQSALLPVCLGKAFLFAFTYACLCRMPGSWLLLRLALFSDCLLLPLLYFLWLRLLRGRLCSWGLIAVPAVLIFTVDYRIISPILASLINY